MTKIEMGVIVTVIIAIISGALYLGRLDGRISALETDKDFSSITERKKEVLAQIEKERKEGVELIKGKIKGGLNQFETFNQRLGALEAHLAKERKPGSAIEPGGSAPWGSWGAVKYCPTNHYVCGLQQKVEGKQDDGDDTAVNAVRFYCCPL